MKTKYANIDSLLDRNAADQLSRLDWDRLHSDIQKRLDHAQDICRPHPRPQTMLKWALGLSAAAAMVTAAYIFQYDGSNGVELLPGQRAAVKLTEGDDILAKVQISQSTNNKYVSVMEPAVQKAQVSFS